MALNTINLGSKMRLAYDDVTGEYGTQIRLINKTGATTVKGYLISPSTTADVAFIYVASNQPDPNWVVYEAGVVDGSDAWVGY